MDFEKRREELDGFLRFVMVDWPGLRNQVSAELTPRCTKCILSDKCSPLEDGVCAVCREAERVGSGQPLDKTEMEQRLSTILSEQAGRAAGPYDATVMFSGGKDSTYLLHRLRSGYPGLRIVALTMDNGFMSPIALANCRHVLARIEDVDHVILRPKNSLYRRAFRHAFTHLNPGGCYTTVDRIDGDLTFDMARNFTAAHDIPLLISGLSPEQVGRILELDDFESPSEREAAPRLESAGFLLSSLFTSDELQRYWWNPSRWPETSRPRVLHPFHAWPYDEQVILSEVVQSGLIPPGSDNPLVTNNDTIPVMLAVDIAKLGYSGFEPEFAELVRQGRADRAMWLAMFEALEYSVQRGTFAPNCIIDTLGRLGLTTGEVGLSMYAG